MSGLYDAYKEAMIGGGNHGGTLIDLDGDTIRVGLLDAADHTTSLTADEDFADITATAFIGESGGSGRADGAAIGTVTLTDGVFDAADTVMASVTGDQAEEILIYKDSGTDATSVLLVNFDSGVTNMPVTPNGGNITVTWAGGGIFYL